uniref:Uncharacterized protein n=1 Tax=Rhipicephalus zambeziensis TaxID=60191 RepID=A0A224YAG3_9ACAR
MVKIGIETDWYNSDPVSQNGVRETLLVSHLSSQAKERNGSPTTPGAKATTLCSECSTRNSSSRQFFFSSTCIGCHWTLLLLKVVCVRTLSSLLKCATPWILKMWKHQCREQCVRVAWPVRLLCSLGSRPRDKPLFHLVRVSLGKAASRAISRVHHGESCSLVAACVTVCLCACMRACQASFGLYLVLATRHADIRNAETFRLGCCVRRSPTFLFFFLSCSRIFV